MTPATPKPIDWEAGLRPDQRARIARDRETLRRRYAAERRAAR